MQSSKDLQQQKENIRAWKIKISDETESKELTIDDQLFIVPIGWDTFPSIRKEEIKNEED